MRHFVVLALVVAQIHDGYAREASGATLGMTRRLLSSSDVKDVSHVANGTTADCEGSNGTCAVSTAQPEVEADQPLWMEVSRSYTTCAIHPT